MTLTTATRYREIEVAGTPESMGHAIGEAARDEIRGFVEVALDRVRLTADVSRERAYRVARESLKFARDYAPWQVRELAATAESAGVSLDDLMLLQVRNQLRDEADAGCTSVSLSSSASAAGHRYVAQNWDNDPALDAFTVVLTRRPEGKPALMTVTQAGLIAYIGLNDAGLGLCLNTLPAPAREFGVPHYFLVRGVYESRSLEAAVAEVSRGARAIPANVMMTTPEGPANLEITLEGVHALRPNGAGRLVHTNHCLHTKTAPFNRQFPELIQSYPRLARMESLMNDGRAPISVERLQQALSDHQDFPRSICRHENDTPDTGFWTTVFSVIIEPEARRMLLARGNPCQRPFEEYRLN